MDSKGWVAAGRGDGSEAELRYMEPRQQALLILSSYDVRRRVRLLIIDGRRGMGRDGTRRQVEGTRSHVTLNLRIEWEESGGLL